MIDGVIQAHADKPFEYGSSDCCKFAVDCVQALTGQDYRERLEYGNQFEAEKLIDRHGSLQATVTALLGREPDNEFVEGSFALVVSGGNEVVGVIHRRRFWARVANDRVAHNLSLKRVIASWRA